MNGITKQQQAPRADAATTEEHDDVFIGLRLKYPTINYGPKVDCPKCKGEGEIRHPGGNFIFAHDGPCVCLFVTHEYLDIALSALESAEEGL